MHTVSIIILAVSSILSKMVILQGLDLFYPYVFGQGMTHSPPPNRANRIHLHRNACHDSEAVLLLMNLVSHILRPSR